MTATQGNVDAGVTSPSAPVNGDVMLGHGDLILNYKSKSRQLILKPMVSGAVCVQQLVAYFRVSTKRQGESGLGLDGQRVAVRQYAEQRVARVLASYTEVESGKRADRAELAKAIGHAKLAKATLVVAKLDRLARNVAFLSSLMEAGVDFVACDNPNANRLTIHILAAVAEDEAQRISDRTKAALAAAKLRGVALGSARHGHWTGREDHRGWRQATEAAALSRRKAAADAYAFLLPSICEMRDDGASFAIIARRLNSDGHGTSAGKPWTATAVWRLIKRSVKGGVDA